MDSNLNRSDYALIGIAVAGLLMIGIPIAVSAEIPLAFAQVTNSTIYNGTHNITTFSNGTQIAIFNGTQIEEPIFEEPVVEETPFMPPLPTGTFSITKYTQPTDSFENLVRTSYGSNYDLIEDFNTGEATWTSHPERIMDGTWKNYVLQNNNQKISIYSNAVGTIVYDLPTCSYSIYENGYNGNQIIPSVSSVATANIDGIWQNLPVNDELCTVDVRESLNGVTITAIKSLFEEVTETDIVNGTSVTSTVNSQTFTHEIIFDTTKGIKETFKVWNIDDVELGISQTVHTGESITVGGQTIDIAQFNGQSFDKQFLEENEAQIFQVAEGLNYDFDVGFESLSSLNIFFDGDYKVNLDYADGGFVNYLEIDPTFTSTSNLDGHVRVQDSSGSSCSNTVHTSYSSFTSTKVNAPYVGRDSGNLHCSRAIFEYDISAIPNDATITDTSFDYEITNVNSPYNCDVLSMNSQPSSRTLQEKWNDFGSATSVITNNSFCTTTGTGSLDLTSGFDNIIQTKVTNSEGWIALGMKATSEVRTSVNKYTYFNSVEGTGQDPTLEIQYTVPTIPQPPTNLVATDGMPIGVGYSAPTDTGALTLDGYNIYRSSDEYSMAELPNNGGNSGVDFANNELLIHGFDGTNNIVDSSSNSIPVNLVNVFKNNLNHYYKFDESSGTITDSCSTINTSCVDQDSTSETSVSYGVTGVKDSAIDTSAGGSQVLFPSSLISVNDYSTGSVSVNMWVKSTSSNSQTNNQYVFGNGCDTSTNRDLCFYWRASTNVGAFPHMKDSSTTITTSFNADLNDGNWHMMTGVVDHVNKEVRGYHNGVLYDTVSFTSLSFSPTADWTIGNYGNSGTGNDYDGYVDELTIYENYALTSNDIDNLYNLGWGIINESTTGTIGNAISSPDLSVTSSLLPDGTDSFTVGGWVQQVESRDSTLDATNNGATTGATGNIGNAWNFDGSNDYVTLGGSLSDWTFLHNTSHEFTISFWHNQASVGSLEMLMSSGSELASAYTGLGLRFQSPDGLYFHFAKGNNQDRFTGTQSGLTFDGNWHHIVITADASDSTNSLQIWEDGALLGTFSNTGKGFSNGNPTNLPTIGRAGSSSGQYMSSDISDFAIYHTKLSNSEISALYNSGSGTSTPDTNGLVAHYDFEQTGSTLENQLYNPPTNTKLLGFNDVTFNVGTTSADISQLVTGSPTTVSHTSSNDWSNIYTSSQHSVGIKLETANANGVGDKLNSITFYMQKVGSPTGNIYGKVFDASGIEVATSTNSHSASALSTGYVSKTFDFDGTYTLQEDDHIVAYYDGGGGSNMVRVEIDTNGNYDGSDTVRAFYQSQFLTPTGDMKFSMNIAPEIQTSIISATGLTDNTSTPQHYSFSRSGNDFVIYQNGQSVATATDSTNFGTISGAHTIKLDGTIDEYFIDSTALTSSEIDTIYEMGLAPTQVGTSTTTSFDDSNVGGGNTYYYYAKATNAVGDSAFSVKTSGLAGTPPNPPTGLTANIQDVNANPLDIYLQWSSPTNVGSGTLTGFEVWRDGSLVTTTGLVTSYTDTVGSAGTYSYEVKAVATHGTSTSSNSASATTPNPPDAPTVTLAINNPNSNPLDITVTPVAPANNGGSAITGYNLYSSSDDVTYNLEASNVNTSQTVTVSSAGTWYFKAEAINPVGTSPLSTASSIATPSVPDAPTSLNAIINDPDNNPNNVTLTWASGASNGGSAITGYKVYITPNAGTQTLLTTTNAGTLTYNDASTKSANTQYTYEVKAINNVGESLGATTNITTLNVPSSPTISILNGTTVASWTVPSSDSNITNYKLYRDGSLVATLTDGTTSHKDTTSIVFGNSYGYQVTAVSLVGESALSNTANTTPITNVDDLQAVSTTGVSTILDWTEPEYYQGSVTSYSVYYSTPYSSSPSTLIGTTANSYLNLYGQLQYSTNYAFMVTVNSVLGNSVTGNIANVTTTEDTSIVTYDPTTGSDWFDIDAQNPESINLTKFTRNDIGTNSTVLTITYPSYYEDLTCDLDYKFGQETLQYSDGDNMQSTLIDADNRAVQLQFNNLSSEVIAIQCADQGVTDSSSSYTLTLNQANVPLFQQISNFRSGDYGTNGYFGALDLIGVFVVIIAMVGFNRTTPIAGVIIGISALLGLAYFGIIQVPATIFGILALLGFLAWGVTKR